MKDIFRGLDRAHGEFVITGKNSRGKVVGQAQTVASPPTDELWDLHTKGKQGIGIVPIDSNNKCSWGAIDIDVYPLDFIALETKINKLSLPLIICQTKSAGAHCFLFLKDPIPAHNVRESLCAWAAWLGYGGCEVFPKQTKLASDEDVGNWLNMPYFGKERLAISGGKDLPLAKFKALAKKKAITLKDLLLIEPPQSDLVPDGPPCLQLLCQQGFPEGTRNEGMFNLGVYCRMAFDDWEGKLEELNHEVMQPPLRSNEVQEIIKQLKRKDYFYRCTQPPLHPVCNKSACLKAKHGVGHGEITVEIQGLTKLETNPPIWFVDVDGVRMQLATTDLTDQNRFQRKCIEVINKCPTPSKRVDWLKKIQELLDTVDVVEAPSDAGPEGQFWSHLYRYIEQGGKGRAKGREALLKVEGVVKEKDRVYFRSTGLMAYLDRVHFREFKPQQIWATLKHGPAEWKGDKTKKVKHHQFLIEGNNIQCWSIPAFDIAPEQSIPDVPDNEEF